MIKEEEEEEGCGGGRQSNNGRTDVKQKIGSLPVP
jgi:hypothetical protein